MPAPARPHFRSRRAWIAFLVVVPGALAGCTAAPSDSPAPAPPWADPVAGTVAVTAWADEGEPTSPFGPDGFPWDSPDQLVESMASALASAGGVRTTGSVVDRGPEGTAVGWVRAELTEPGPDAVIAVDFRLTLRREAGSWFVARNEVREHCARPLEGAACH